MAFDVTQVQKALAGFDYPGGSEDLAYHADRLGADSEVVESLRGLDRRDFDGPNAVMAELSENGALGRS